MKKPKPVAIVQPSGVMAGTLEKHTCFQWKGDIYYIKEEAKYLEVDKMIVRRVANWVAGNGWRIYAYQSKDEFFNPLCPVEPGLLTVDWRKT